MNLPVYWNADWTAPLINHLWQSTIVVAIAWLLALALRKNHARARYWVWMVASAKFLLPFSLLMTAGEWLRSRMAAPIVAKPALANAMEQIAQPFPQVQFFDAGGAPVAALHANLLPVILLAVWACGASIAVFRFGRGWLRVYTAKRAARPLALAADVPVIVSSSLIEPGIFGIFRPALLLPEGILERLTPEQLRAIIAHEMCHVRRRDNLTFAIHMVVEALFWFHPAVWWIGARLIEERERACDEAVLAAGAQAEDYAEGILNVCKFYVESPLECVSGVTGSDLKERVVRIMARHAGLKMSLGRKLLLGAAGLLALAVPVAFGLVHIIPIYGQMVHATGPLPSYEVATIKRVDESAAPQPGQMRISIKNYILNSYGISSLAEYQIEGGPEWIGKDLYVIDGKIPDDLRDAMQKMTPEQQAYQRSLLMQSLLADRFKLKVHFVTKQIPVYELAVAKSGLKIKEVRPLVPGAAPPPPPIPGAALPPGAVSVENKDGVTVLNLRAAKMRMLINMLWRDPEIAGRPIVDKTGLTGSFDVVNLQWVGLSAPSDAVGPSLPKALEEQLGLKLTATKGPVEMVVIDSIERPSPN
jgi:bla regulator protein BlaR1